MNELSNEYDRDILTEDEINVQEPQPYNVILFNVC